ncbi:MAG TPA: DUF1800 domain-containing protein, partial [Fimbriimonas sp.]|nr:DUF1800 domain-containing protein [Fimbriimonas sp.]
MSIIEEQPIGTSRRDLFALIGTGALLTAATAARAQSGGSLSQKQLQAKLLRRISYGPTEADMAAIASLGYDAYLEQQLNPTAIADVACDALLTQFPSLKYGSRQLFMADNQTLRYEQTSAMLVRAIYSNRQLLERMVEFWTDHFNIYWPTVRTLKAAHDRDVIRANALGNFGDLLLANARSGAMMKYLDNGSNRKAGPNENYARELLELHTMGVNNGYTQQDIIEIARCFTGWTVQLDPTASNAGAFYYDSLRHDGGAKTVLGRRIKAGGGVNDGTTVIQILTGRKETASYLSKKLCTFFLGHAPKALVDDLTRSFQSTGGEIKPLLRLILK